MADAPSIPEQARWAPCVPRPGCIYAVGLNYHDHAAESGATVPEEPLIFNKAPAAVCGPYDDLVLPLNRQQVDWEVELAVIIGQPARFLATPEESLSYIGGYCLANDVSERHDQKQRVGQWIKGKAMMAFVP